MIERTPSDNQQKIYDAVERLVDTRNISYERAWKIVGYPEGVAAIPTVEPELKTADKKTARHSLSTRPIESPYTDIGSDTADSDPWNRTPEQVRSDLEQAQSPNEEYALARDALRRHNAEQQNNER